MLALTGMAGFVACVGDDPAAGPLADGGASSSGLLDGASTADAGDGDGAVPGSGIVVDDRYSPGTRLEPSWLSLPDGSQRFVGWYDKQLRTPCTYRVQANGRYACVPNAEGANDQAGIYADPSCTAPQAGVVEASCSRIPSFVNLTYGATCFDDVYASGASIANPYVLTSSCAPAIDRGKAFVVGAKLASSELVQGDVEEWADAPPPNGARPVRAQFMRGDDGSVGFHRWVLETGRTECRFSKQPFDETVRCYPVAPAPVNPATFADSGCTQLIAEVGNARTACTGETTQIAALVHRATEACSYLPTGTEWFTVNPGTATSFFQKNSAGECVPYPVLFGQAHAVGTPLPVETFGAPRVEAPTEGQAFSSLHVLLADGTRGRHGFYDGTRKVGCTLERAADLSFRCIPEGSQAVRGFFTDAACTVSKLVVRVVSTERSAVDQCQDKGDCDAGASLTCAAPPKPAYARQTSYPGCSFDQITRAFSVGESVAQYYERDRMGACVSHVVGTGEGVYELTEIPPAELPGAVQSHP